MIRRGPARGGPSPPLQTGAPASRDLAKKSGGRRALGASYCSGRHHRDLLEVVVRHAGDSYEGTAVRTSAEPGITSAEKDGTSACGA